MPWGYLKSTQPGPASLVGYGPCNNPLTPPPDLILAQTNPLRTPFGNHAFVAYMSRIYDATVGPHIGTETLAQFANNSIDLSTDTERAVSPDANRNGTVSVVEANAAIVPTSVSGMR
jgi:hypothetical protein